MKQMLTMKRFALINTGFLLVLVFFALLFCFVGDPYISPRVLWQQGHSLDQSILFYARLPRILLAIFVGAGLSMSGVSFQSLLRNPLADPYILGVSGGAALGSVLGLAFALSYTGVSLLAFAFGFLSLFLIYWIAQVRGTLPVHTLLLTGVIFNAFSFALILLINSLVSIGQAHQILYLLMGSLEAHSMDAVLWVGGMTLIGLVILLFQVSAMNVVSLGEQSAIQLGVSVHRSRKWIFLGASIMVGASVALSGLIGFVGLFVPHMVRLMFGNDHRLLLPLSATLGGVFLLISDFVARTLFSGTEFQTQLPVGVVTALIGGPFFVYLLKTSKVS